MARSREGPIGGVGHRGWRTMVRRVGPPLILTSQAFVKAFAIRRPVSRTPVVSRFESHVVRGGLLPADPQEHVVPRFLQGADIDEGPIGFPTTKGPRHAHHAPPQMAES
jgi:hypothetical protein